MNHQTQLVTVKTEVISVINQPGSSEYWDAKKAGAILGRSRRTVLRYIENGTLEASKVEGPTGPEWRIVPFTVSRPQESVETLHDRIAQLERELECLRNSQKVDDSIDMSVNEVNEPKSPELPAKEINPSLLQTVAAFFMISSTKLGLAQRFTSRSE